MFMCFDGVLRNDSILKSPPTPKSPRQHRSIAAFKSLGLTESIAARLHSLWENRSDDDNDRYDNICEFVIQYMQERVFAETFDPEGNHLPVPHLYLIGLDKPANFAGSLGVTGELLQLTIDMFQGSHDRHYVMPTKVWVERAIRIQWNIFSSRDEVSRRNVEGFHSCKKLLICK